MANRNVPNTKDRTLDAFKGRMIGGGARPNLFECELYFPEDSIPERWMNLINKHEDNAGITNPTDYQKDLYVKQLGRAEVGGKVPTSESRVPVLKQYKFLGTFPSNISEIALSYDSSDTIEEFSVTMEVQWVDVLDPTGSTQIGTGS